MTEQVEQQGVESWTRKRFSAVVAAIVLLSIMVYAGSLTGLKIWDDYVLIGGSAIGGGRSLWSCFTEPFLGFYYRPLVSASFWLDLRLWGQTPFFFHQTNILLHAATTGALVGLALAAFRSRAVALLAGTLFAVQPAQVSTVAWIGGRTDSLCALAMTLFAWALISAARSTGRQRIWAVTMATLAYTAALFTKEQMLATLPLAPLAFWAFQPREAPGNSESAWKTGWLATIPMAVASGIFITLWVFLGPPRPVAPATGAIEILGRAIRTTTYYGELLVTPTPASLHTLTLNRFEQAGVWPLVVGIGLFALFIHAAWRWRNTDRPAFWLLAFITLTLLPVSNLIPMPSLLVAPYRAGVTGLASSILIAWLLLAKFARINSPADSVTPQSQRSFFKPQARAVAVAGLVAWSAGLTVWGCKQWSSAETIFRKIVQYDPGSIVARYNLTAALLDTKEPGKRKEAIAHLEAVLNLLYGSESWRDSQSAIKAFHTDRAIRDRVRINQGNRVEPEKWLSELFAQLGYAQLDEDQLAKAHASFNVAEAFYANNHNVQAGLGSCFYLEGDMDRARRHLEKAIAIMPTMAEAYGRLGEIYVLRKDWSRAVRALATCIKLQPYLGHHYVMMGSALLELHDLDGAEAAAHEALRRDPRRPDAAELLARVRKARALGLSSDANRRKPSVATLAGTGNPHVEP